MRRFLLTAMLLPLAALAQIAPQIQDTGKVGPAQVGDGATSPMRTGRTSELVVSDAHARFQEAVSRGNVFTAANQAAVSTPAGLTASSVNFTLYNPAGSGKNCVLLQVDIGIAASPAAATVIWLAANTNPTQAAPSTVTSLVVHNALMTNQTGTCVAYSTATLAAAPVVVRNLAYAAGASTTGLSGNAVIELAGSVIVSPGTYVSIQGSAAASIFSAMTWEETPQ